MVLTELNSNVIALKMKGPRSHKLSCQLHLSVELDTHRLRIYFPFAGSVLVSGREQLLL